MASDFKIGTTLEGIVSLDALTVFVPDPRTSFRNYSKLLDLGNGMKRGAGWPTAEWHYGYLLQEQREQLRSFCTGASAEVFMRTRTRDEDDSETPILFKIYKAVMIWPETEEYIKSKRIDFVIKFTRLEEQEDEEEE